HVFFHRADAVRLWGMRRSSRRYRLHDGGRAALVLPTGNEPRPVVSAGRRVIGREAKTERRDGHPRAAADQKRQAPGGGRRNSEKEGKDHQMKMLTRS